MKLAALLLIGSVALAPELAQGGTPPITFLPIPDRLPAFLFAPGPLSGTMLRPLIEPDAPPPSGHGATPKPRLAQGAPSSPSTETAVATPDAVPASAATPEPAPAPVPPPITPDAPTLATVTVIVENIQSNSGTVNIALCDMSLSHDGCPYTHKVPAEPGFVQTEFDDIPPGRYAVVSYHDVNGNNQFDKILGIPREPYALSGSAADMLVPTFDDAALPIAAGENSVIIRLHHVGG